MPREDIVPHNVQACKDRLAIVVRVDRDLVRKYYCQSVGYMNDIDLTWGKRIVAADIKLHVMKSLQ